MKPTVIHARRTHVTEVQLKYNIFTNRTNDVTVLEQMEGKSRSLRLSLFCGCRKCFYWHSVLYVHR